MSKNLKFLIGAIVVVVVVIVGSNFVEKKKKDKIKESNSTEAYSFGASSSAKIAPPTSSDPKNPNIPSDNPGSSSSTSTTTTTSSTGAVVESSSSEKIPELADDSGFAPIGSYEVYSEEKVIEKSKTSRVVLFFNAIWCPTCRALDRSIKASQHQIPGDITILSVDYDTYSDLKKKYGVTYQHTLVQVDANGDLVTKWSGSPTLSSLVQKVQ